MFFTSKRATIPRILLPVSMLLTGALLSGCSSDSNAATDVDTSSESAGSGSAFDQALAFAECMRAEGVPDFPDPEQADGGIQMGAGNVDTNSAAFQTAMNACRDKAPQAENPAQNGGEPLDPKKVAAWAECIRENGVPKFPDPEINGGQMALDFAGAGLHMSDPAFQTARSACQDKWPGGGMMIQGGGGQ